MHSPVHRLIVVFKLLMFIHIVYGWTVYFPFNVYLDSNVYSSKKETQNHIKKRNAKPHQKKKRKTTSKKETQNHIQKRNAKPHIGDIGKIILIAVW